MLKKLFRPEKLACWQIHGKETIDEIIFRTTNARNRLMLDLMARGGMRVGEVLKLAAVDVDYQKLTNGDPFIRSNETPGGAQWSTSGVSSWRGGVETA
jgi:integrase/recombinase XerD